MILFRRRRWLIRLFPVRFFSSIIIIILCLGERWLLTVMGIVTGKKARYEVLADPNDMNTKGEYWREQERDVFIYSQFRDGEYFGNGPTEIQTAAALKKVAFKAKGEKGRETLITVREFMEREFAKV